MVINAVRKLFKEHLILEDEDLIPVEDVIISLTNNGYVKRMPVDTYKTQKPWWTGNQGNGN